MILLERRMYLNIITLSPINDNTNTHITINRNSNDMNTRYRTITNVNIKSYYVYSCIIQNCCHINVDIIINLVHVQYIYFNNHHFRNNNGNNNYYMW